MIELEYSDIFNKTIEKLQFSKNLIKHSYNEKSLFAILVDGKSMEPLINDRAVVVADLSNKTLKNDGIYLVYYNNKMWIKRYNIENDTFFSINPAFSHLIYKKEEIHIVAKVLLTFTNL